jgi:hypothetical protein
MPTAKEYVEKYTELGNKHKALETKYTNLRACVSGMAAQLRELDGPYNEEEKCTTAWPQVPSFGIYMQLLQALMGAAPPEYVSEELAKESRKKFKFKGNGNRYK